MFVVDKNFPTERRDQDWRMVNPETGVWLQEIVSYSPLPAGVFKLVDGEAVVPFNARYTLEKRTDGDGAEKSFLHWEIAPPPGEPFGRADRARLEGVLPYDFPSDSERRRLGLLAVESLLEFGASYDGSKREHKFTVTVSFDGHRYSKADFR